MHNAGGSESIRRSMGDVGKFARCDEPGREVLAIETHAANVVSVRSAAGSDRSSTGMPTCTSDRESLACAELLAPAANRLIANRHATLEQQLFDVAQAELKANVPAHRMADDHLRELVAVIKRFRFRHRIM